MRPDASWTRRPLNRLTISSSSTCISTTWSISTPDSSNASAWGIVRGKPSNKKPFPQSLSVIRSLTKPIIKSSDTNSPASIIAFALTPNGVPAFTAALNISPVDIWGIPYFSQINCACVPFPAPGAPSKMIRIS